VKVILRQNFEQLGQLGDVIEVKEGYARNYLIPKKIAYPATAGYLKTLEEEKKQVARREQKELRSAEKLATDLDKVSLTIPMKVGEEDKLFGAVTSQMIAEYLAEKGFDVDKRKIEVGDHIKALGVYSVEVKLHSNVTAKVKVWVVKE
jgi:large subunit ribosomal protein L9